MARRTRLTKQNIATLYERLAEGQPHPQSELNWTNPYTLLVAVSLSAQATDVGVNKATGPLFEQISTPEEMVALGEEALKEQIKTIGLFRNKAKNAIAMSKLLIADHGGRVPETREELVKLPGVGRKTANVVLNVAFGQPTIAVDTHIFRVGNRTGLAPGATPDEVEDILCRVTPESRLMGAHHWLILHGRYICTARKPKCPTCPILEICKFKDKTK